MSDDSDDRFEITLVASSRGDVSKTISLGPDGQLVAVSGDSRIPFGSMHRWRLPSLAHFGRKIDKLHGSWAIALGQMRADLPKKAPLVVKEMLPESPGHVARSRQYLVSEEGQRGLLLLDHDTKKQPPSIGRRLLELGGFGAALALLDPQLAHVGYVERRSTSSGVYNAITGERFPDSGGLHRYLLAKDGADRQRYLNLLAQIGWLHGLSYYYIGEAGQLLERSIIDASVGGSERLIFEAAPRLSPPLKQDPREARFVDGPLLDTHALQDLTPKLKAEIEDIKRQAAAALGKAAKAAKRKFVDKKIAEIRAKNPKISVKQARRAAERQCAQVLTPDVLLHFDDAALGVVSVAEVLEDPERFVEQALADPIEGPSYGATTAILFRRSDGRLWIYSFAHGRTDYTIEGQDGGDFVENAEGAPGPADYRIEPPHDAPRVELQFQTLAQARDALRDAVVAAIDSFLDMPEGGENPVTGIPAGIGVGKTEAALKAIYAALLEVRRRSGKAGRRVVALAVPTHRLSGEIEPRFSAVVETSARRQQQAAVRAGLLPRTVERIGRRARLTVATWRGRSADNPAATGEKMCQNLDAVKMAQELQQDVEGGVCRTCPLRDGCAYLGQKHKRADLWIIAHQALFNSAPPSFPAAGVEFLVIDESPDKAALRGVDANARMELDPDDLSEGATPLPPVGKMAPHNIKRLEKLRGKACSALRKAKPGSIRAASLRRMGITAYDARRAAGAERRRIYRGPDPCLLEHNRNVEPMVRMWLTVAELLQEGGPEISGRLTLIKSAKTNDRKLMITGYDKIHPHYRCPTLLIDASLDAERAKPLFPQINVVDFLPVDMPFVTLKKSVGRSCGKSMLLPIKPEGDKELTKAQIEANLTRKNNRDALRLNLVNLARAHSGKKILVASYKELIKLLELPPTIATANFNALAGRDEWADFDIVVIIGRPLPPPWAVEAISGAITGAEPKRTPVIDGRKQWYDKRPSQHIVRKKGDGFVGVDAKTDSHPDDMADRHLRRICKMEVDQAIGRLRGVQRTAEKRATIIVLNDCVLDTPVDELFDADLFFRVSPQERMLAEGGVAFESPVDAVKFYPELWPSVKAAQKALERSKSMATFSYKETLIGKCRHALVSYRRKGNGQQSKRCLADLSVVPDPKAALEAMLGPLAMVMVVREEATAPSDPKGPAFVDEQIGQLAALMGHDKRELEAWIGQGRLREPFAEATAEAAE